METRALTALSGGGGFVFVLIAACVVRKQKNIEKQQGLLI